MSSLEEAASQLSRRCAQISKTLSGKVSFVYNPLEYAWEVHKNYLTKYGQLGAKTVLLGMNPGPWGMGQTGVAFGDIDKVKNYLNLSGSVTEPPTTHSKRPVYGLATTRNEVSGTRLWGIIEEIFGGACEAHSKLFVVNHCPLMMFDENGKNLTPDKLSGEAAAELMRVCDEHLAEVVQSLGAERVIGVGAYAEKQAKKALSGCAVEVSRIPHPSPASPLANRNGGADWREAVRLAFSEI